MEVSEQYGTTGQANKAELDLPGLTSGTYYYVIRVDSGGAIEIKKTAKFPVLK
ncbi:MAG: hypothetical protein LLG37_05900 [Spirochaetia bacterium]|nr:hypothetical protein [Spirochaetia bacterium]